MATHSSILAWKIPWTEEPGYSLQATVHGVAMSWTRLSDFTFTFFLTEKTIQSQETRVQSPWRRKWHPLSPIFLLGESHGWRSLASYNPWGHKESDMTEHLSTGQRAVYNIKGLSIDCDVQ